MNEDTAPIVQQIFQWAAEGIPLNVIVKRLNEDGVMTPGCYQAHVGLITSKRIMGGGKWQSWVLNRLLADEVYTGDMVQGKHTTTGHRQIPTKPEDWIVVRNTHEPIISRELFAEVQVIRQKAAEKYTQNEKKPYTENILRGRVFCGCCGKNLHRQRSDGRYFYRCISNDRLGKGSCVKGVRYLSENELFNTILTIIRQEAEAVMGKALWLKQCDGRIAARKAAVDREISELQQQTVKSRGLLAGLYGSFVKGVLTRAEYLGMQEDYSQKISGAVKRVQQLQTEQSEFFDFSRTTTSFLLFRAI